MKKPITFVGLCHNKAATALANKLARIVWAVWKHHRPFHSMPNAARAPSPAPRLT